MLSDIILQILNGGARLRSREIAQKASLLSGGDYISKEDIKKEIFSKLKEKVTYDNTTYQYYLSGIKSQSKQSIKIESKEMILKVIGNSNKPLTAIDISNEIRKIYKCTVQYENIEIIILTELKYDIGIIKDRVIKYYLY